MTPPPAAGPNPHGAAPPQKRRRLERADLAGFHAGSLLCVLAGAVCLVVSALRPWTVDYGDRSAPLTHNTGDSALASLLVVIAAVELLLAARSIIVLVRRRRLAAAHLAAAPFCLLALVLVLARHSTASDQVFLNNNNTNGAPSYLGDGFSLAFVGLGLGIAALVLGFPLLLRSDRG